MSKPLRWGIVSAGQISFDFCVALTTLPADEHIVVAVAARQQERAAEFAKKFDIPNFFGSYEKLAKCADVDIIYIGALNPQHYEIGKMMLEHGKHVLCEKPLCLNRKQATSLIQLAEAKKLFLMEAVWSRFFPSYQYVRQQIDSGALGEIQEVIVSFGYPHNEVDRLQKKELGGGTILDLGIYTIQLTQWAFQEPPYEIYGKGELNADGVDINLQAELVYSRGRVAKMSCSSKGELENVAIIKGSKGQVTIPQFWCPLTIIDTDGKQKSWELPAGRYPTIYPNSQGLRYEAEAVRQSILAGKLENDTVSHCDSLLFAKIQDELRRQLGVTFDADGAE